MRKEYDVAVITGRFHPLVPAHLAAIRDLKADRLMIAVIGKDMPRSARYPFTTDEQMLMIKSALPNTEVASIFESLTPQERVTELRAATGPVSGNVCLAAFDEDYGAEIIDNLAGWDLLTMNASAQIDANTARLVWMKDAEENHNPYADDILDVVRDLAQFTELQAESRYIEDYKASWKIAPYPPIFVTVDTLIRVEGQVLLIQRGGFPGRGQWALPGGFVDDNERLFDAALRELREETGLKLTPHQAQACLVHQQVFDQPRRCARGRIITHGYAFDLDRLGLKPQVKAGDDAAALKWVPVDKAVTMRSQIFEDHYLVLMALLFPRL